MRLFPHVTAQTIIAAGADGVINAIAIPGQSKLHRVWMDFALVANSAQGILTASMYGLTAYIIPVLDPDATQTPDAMWDLQIPKDDAIGSDVIDMDNLDTADTTPELEPGDPSLEEMFNVGSRPERIFERTEVISFGKQSAGFEVGTPDTFVPRDAWKSKISRAYQVEFPSVLAFGLSAPVTTGTNTTFFVPNTNEEWLQLRFMADTAKDAWKQAVGLTEAGAETPYVEAGILMGEYLERFVEQTAAAWSAQGYTVFTDFRYEIEVEGELSIHSLSAGA